MQKKGGTKDKTLPNINLNLTTDKKPVIKVNIRKLPENSSRTLYKGRHSAVLYLLKPQQFDLHVKTSSFKLQVGFEFEETKFKIQEISPKT